MPNSKYLIPLVLLIALLMGACSPSQAELDAQATKIAADVFATQTAAAPTATPTPEATATFTPTPTDTPTPTPTPGPLTPNEVFSLISPSVVFVETESGSGSGVLTEGGYIVTNAHVVWPFETVRIVFPDGTEFAESPVLGWDLIGDLAVVGPIETDIETVALVDGEDSIIGSDAYLIGYPAEVESFPRPTIARGIISRLREWESVGMTFFQTDASIAGGQSGGVLVSEKGEVIGISGYSIGDGEFGIVASANDVTTRVKGLLDGKDVDGLGPRQLQAEAGRLEHEFSLGHDWDVALYIVDEPKDTEIDIEVKGDTDIALEAVDILGDVVTYADDQTTGQEEATITVEFEEPYFLKLSMFDQEEADFEINSSHNLIPYHDIDDNQAIELGQTVAGNLDYPSDFDYFTIELEEGDTIAIHVDSLLLDTYVSATAWEDQDNEYVSDDDSGGGFFGLDAELIYQAAYSGRHLVIVEDSYGYEIGGYFLSVEEAPDDAVPAQPDRGPEVVDTPHGEMIAFEFPPYPFTFLRPVDWEMDTENNVVCRLVTVCYISDDGSILAVAIEDLDSLGLEAMSQEAYVDLVLGVVENSGAGFELMSRERVEVQPGLSGEVLELSMQGGLLQVKRFIYLHAGTVGINISFITSGARYDDLQPLIQYTFDSFELVEPAEGEADADYYLDQGATFLSAGETDKAIDAFTQAIELDPELVGAYQKRAAVYIAQNEYDQALADINQAIDLDPDQAELYHDRGLISWMQADFESALTDLDQAVDLDETYDQAYNLRALVHTMQGDYEQALDDANTALKLRQVGQGNADLLDTRGFVHLKAGDYEQAKADFEAIFDQGLSFPYAELGGGLAYAALDETDKAIELLEAGLAGVQDVETPGPQLADLIKLAEEVLAGLE